MMSTILVGGVRHLFSFCLTEHFIHLARTSNDSRLIQAGTVVSKQSWCCSSEGTSHPFLRPLMHTLGVRHFKHGYNVSKLKQAFFGLYFLFSCLLTCCQISNLHILIVWWPPNSIQVRIKLQIGDFLTTFEDLFASPEWNSRLGASFTPAEV
jgi:hypothetical protein